MYLLDTNICIDFALGRSEPLRERVRVSFANGLAISTVTLAELRVGARHRDASPSDEQRLDRLVAILGLHDFDARAAEEYGSLARQIGIRRSSFDRLIAAHARSLGLTLVTNNVADFAEIPGLVVENWTMP